MKLIIKQLLTTTFSRTQATRITVWQKAKTYRLESIRLLLFQML